MKKTLILLALSLLMSCSINEDETTIKEINESTNLIVSSADRAPVPGSMTVSCTNIPSLIYTGVINWNLGNTIPYPDANVFIQIQPTCIYTIFTTVDISIPYLTNGSMNIIHSAIGTLGDVTLSGNDIFIYAKTFNYRYIIYDNNSNAFVSTSWYSHNLIQYCPNCRADQIMEP